MSKRSERFTNVLTSKTDGELRAAIDKLTENDMRIMIASLIRASEACGIKLRYDRVFPEDIK